MKTSLFVTCLLTLAGCAPADSARPAAHESKLDLPAAPPDEDAGAASVSLPWPDGGAQLHEGGHALKRPKHTYKPVKHDDTPTDPGLTDPDRDGGMEPDTDPEEEEQEPTVDAGPGHGRPLRHLSMRMTGMENDVARFAQFRLANEAREFHIMFVIHEGLTSGTYEWELPNALFTDESYTLDFFIDHDETTGPGFYDKPPLDHAWSIPIPAGDGDVAVVFPFNTHFTDIEEIAPAPFDSTVLNLSGLAAHADALIDVRVIDHRDGRLVGRQVRVIPGDVFDVTVGSTTHPGVEYQVDLAVDANGNGRYDHPADPSWRVTGTADATGLHPRIDTSTAVQTDVGF